MFVDTHCHLFREYYDDIDKVIQDAKNSGVISLFVAGCDSNSNQQVIELLKKHDCIYGCLGIHPSEASCYSLNDLLYIKSHSDDDKVLAIGEIGLDYHYTKDNMEEQKILFCKQLDIAQEAHLPVVIHSRDATLDTISILKMYPRVKGVIHAFSGSIDVAQIYIGLGYKLGINGVVTFKNCHLKDILPSIVDSIVLETDSPYLSPSPYRGIKNEPRRVSEIAKFICDCCSISLGELSKITNANIDEIYRK